MPTMRVTVYRNEEMSAQGTFENPQHLAWIEEGKANKWWGDPSFLRFEIEDITAEVALNQVLNARREEYPGIEEFLNAFFDGGDSAIEELRQKRLAIKAKYPKP